MTKARLGRVNHRSKAGQAQKLNLWVDHRGFCFLGYETSSERGRGRAHTANQMECQGTPPVPSFADIGAGEVLSHFLFCWDSERGAEHGKVGFRLWLRCLWDTQAVWSTAIGVVVLGLESTLQEGEIRGSCPLYQIMGRLCLCGERLESGSRGTDHMPGNTCI